jgi:hypothetical protein
LIYLLLLPRVATRAAVVPLQITTTVPLEPEQAYRDYFGVRRKIGYRLSITFSRNDVDRPFFTMNPAIGTCSSRICADASPIWRQFQHDRARATNEQVKRQNLCVADTRPLACRTKIAPVENRGATDR